MDYWTLKWPFSEWRDASTPQVSVKTPLIWHMQYKPAWLEIHSGSVQPQLLLSSNSNFLHKISWFLYEYQNIETHVRKARELYFLIGDKHSSNREQKENLTLISVNSTFVSNFMHFFFPPSQSKFMYGIFFTIICFHIMLWFLQRLDFLIYVLSQALNWNFLQDVTWCDGFGKSYRAMNCQSPIVLRDWSGARPVISSSNHLCSEGEGKRNKINLMQKGKQIWKEKPRWSQKKQSEHWLKKARGQQGVSPL